MKGQRLIPLMAFLFASGLPFARSHAMVAPIPFEAMIAGADLIVVGKVLAARDKDNRPIAEVRVAEVIKGPADLKGKTVRYFAAGTWMCDITTAVEGETTLLFLVRGKPDPPFKELLPDDVYMVVDAGRGRMPVVGKDENGEYIDVWIGDVFIPEGLFLGPPKELEPTTHFHLSTIVDYCRYVLSGGRELSERLKGKTLPHVRRLEVSSAPGPDCAEACRRVGFSESTLIYVLDTRVTMIWDEGSVVTPDESGRFKPGTRWSIVYMGSEVEKSEFAKKLKMFHFFWSCRDGKTGSSVVCPDERPKRGVGLFCIKKNMTIRSPKTGSREMDLWLCAPEGQRTQTLGADFPWVLGHPGTLRIKKTIGKDETTVEYSEE